MSKFENLTTKIVVSVADSKDERFASGWKPYTGEPDELDNLADWKVADLKAYAVEQGIDLGEATKKADILAAIEAVSPDAEVNESDEEPASE